VELKAWEAFCRLVGQGAGALDDPRAAAAPPESSEKDRIYLTGLVEHHRVNTLPFLIDQCGLKGRSVLELGAGTAGLSVAMVQGGVREVTGVEPIRLNHEAGLLRVRAYRLEARIRLEHVPDTTHLPQEDAAFDACICCSVLQYVPCIDQRRALLQEMHRVVRPGGLIIVCGSGNAVMPGGPHTTAWWSNLAPRRAAARGHQRGVSYWELRRALAPLGVERYRAPAGSAGGVALWHRRAVARGVSGVHLAAHRAALGAFALCEATLCRWFDAPVEAFLPYLAVAFRKRMEPPRT
jgi:ubiquinone/menaquinone biosynthesis C-methylase UbiE